MANEFARHLRKNMTDTERFAWGHLRYRQLGGFRFRRQAPIGPYIADFVCFEAKLILELDGGQHAARAEADAVRTAWLESQGFRVFRVWIFEAFQDWDAVAEAIWKLLTERTGESGRS
jgi:very-short-patch-repair endonuclease